MPAEHDYPPLARTEQERLEHKRYQSAHAFEQGHDPVPRSSVSACSTCDHPDNRPIPRYQHFANGVGEQRRTGVRGVSLSTEDQYILQRQQLGL